MILWPFWTNKKSQGATCRGGDWGLGARNWKTVKNYESGVKEYIQPTK